MWIQAESMLGRHDICLWFPFCALQRVQTSHIRLACLRLLPRYLCLVKWTWAGNPMSGHPCRHEFFFWILHLDPLVLAVLILNECSFVTIPSSHDCTFRACRRMSQLDARGAFFGNTGAHFFSSRSLFHYHHHPGNVPSFCIFHEILISNDQVFLGIAALRHFDFMIFFKHS